MPNSRRFDLARTTGPRRALLLLMGLAVAFAAQRQLDYAGTAAGIDFYQFRVVGQAASTGVNVYAPEARVALAQASAARARQPRERMAALQRPVLETYSTPLLYTFFAASTSDNYEFDYTLYQQMSMLALVGGLILLGRSRGMDWPLLLALLLAALEWLDPVASDVRTANVNRLQLGGLGVLAWLLGRRTAAADVLAGVVLGLLLIFKPNLAAVAGATTVHLLATGRAQRLGQLAMGAVGAVVLAATATLAAFGSLRCWAWWWEALRSLPPDIIGVEKGNCAWPLLLGYSGSSFLFLTTAAVLLAAYGGVLLRGRTTEAADETLAVAVGSVVALLSSPLVWLHYFVLALPMLVVVLTSGARPPAREAVRLGLAGLAFVALANAPIVTIHLTDPRLAAALPDLAVIVLLALAWFDVSGRQANHAA